MRFLIVLIIFLLALFYFMPEQQPPTAEESFIGDQVEVLREAERYEDDYLRQEKARQDRLEKEIEQSAGGG